MRIVNNKQPDPAHPQPVAQIRITIMNNGSVNVNGFPTDLREARHWLFMAEEAVMNYFINKAKVGELDENNRLIEKKIITKDKGLVGADGRPLQ